MGVTIEVVHIPVGDDDEVRGLLVLPAGSETPTPAALVANGLEGTIAELLIPLLTQRDSGIGLLRWRRKCNPPPSQLRQHSTLELWAGLRARSLNSR